MKILEMLGDRPQNCFTLSEIATPLGLDKGTCSNILKTLSSGGYVQQEFPRSGYKLGYRLYHLTGRTVENEELTKIARRDIDALGMKLNETALLSAVRNDRRVVLYSTVPDRDIYVRTSVQKSLYSACTGRVIIANYSPAHLEKLLIRTGLPDRDEWPEIYASPNPGQDLMNRLAQIRQGGYAVHHDPNGIVGFAAPVFQGGHVAGAVGVYLPEARLEGRDSILGEVLAAANEINRKISLTYGSSPYVPSDGTSRQQTP